MHCREKGYLEISILASWRWHQHRLKIQIQSLSFRQKKSPLEQKVSSIIFVKHIIFIKLQPWMYNR